MTTDTERIEHRWLCPSHIFDSLAVEMFMRKAFFSSRRQSLLVIHRAKKEPDTKEKPTKMFVECARNFQTQRTMGEKRWSIRECSHCVGRSTTDKCKSTLSIYESFRCCHSLKSTCLTSPCFCKLTARLASLIERNFLGQAMSSNSFVLDKPGSPKISWVS